MSFCFIFLWLILFILVALLNFSGAGEVVGLVLVFFVFFTVSHSTFIGKGVAYVTNPIKS